MLDKNIKALIKAIREHFPGRIDVTSNALLASLLETTFLTSTITDEGRKVQCSIAVFDSTDLDTDTPEIVRSDRWSITTLKEPIPFTPEHLARISQAARPHAAALAVRPGAKSGWSIWGLVDQEHLVQGFRHHRSDKFYPRAGRFQIEIVSPGCIAIYCDTVLIAQLRRDSLTREFQDVFHKGPLAKALDKMANGHRSRVAQAVLRWKGPSDDLKPDAKPSDMTIAVPGELLNLWLERAKERWLEALSGTLLEMRQLQHGGALLIVPQESFTDLSIKHEIDYRRLEGALTERCASDIMEWAFHHYGRHTDDEDRLRIMLLELQQAERRQMDAARGEAGAMQFISSLSGIDGLVLAVGGMNVRGFGVEILAKRDPKNAYLATRPTGAAGEQIDPTRWGTRHRSMMRFCAKHKGSIGFVVSQDGDVRAMMRVADRLMVWPNVDIERAAMMPFEVPCPHCFSVGDLVPVQVIDSDEKDPEQPDT